MIGKIGDGVFLLYQKFPDMIKKLLEDVPDADDA